ncbi:MAG: acyl carrier protein [Aquihabitans sp.]
MTAPEKVAAMTRLLEREVAAVLAEEDLDFDPLPRAFAELGWDSLSVVELQYRLQRSFGCDLPPEAFEVDGLDALAVELVDDLDERGIWPASLT